MEARKSKLDRFYEESLRIDDQTKTNNHSLLGIIRLFLDDKVNEVTEDPKFDPFLQFVKRILVHLMSSSDRSLAGTASSLERWSGTLQPQQMQEGGHG